MPVPILSTISKESPENLLTSEVEGDNSKPADEKGREAVADAHEV